MRKLLILFLLAGISAGQAQVIQLDEARVTFKPAPVKITSHGGNLDLAIMEEYNGQFHSNPLLFIKKNFDVKPYVLQLKKGDEKFDSFLVEFRSNKGKLEARYSETGELLSTMQRFRDVPVPIAIAQQLYRDHKGWAMVNNTYVASGQGDKVEKELYRIKLKNGTSAQIVKIRPAKSTEGRIAGN
ncbi:hypothetical protein BH23BAC2_BH23BAC2_21700 [soil metagenome]